MTAPQHAPVYCPSCQQPLARNRGRLYCLTADCDVRDAAEIVRFRHVERPCDTEETV